MQTLSWEGDHLRLLDQTLLPVEERYLDLHDEHEVAEAICSMRVRGAPALGCAAAYGLALAARRHETKSPEGFRTALQSACAELIATRPTAVNIAWAVTRMQSAINGIVDPEEAAIRLLDEACAIQDEDLRSNREMGRLGAELLPQRGHRADALQRGRAGAPGLWHGARRHAGGGRGGQAD